MCSTLASAPGDFARAIEAVQEVGQPLFVKRDRANLARAGQTKAQNHTTVGQRAERIVLNCTERRTLVTQLLPPMPVWERVMILYSYIQG